MTRHEFVASANIYADDGEIITIGFADDPENPSNYLTIESSYEYDDQEKRLGLDKIYLELNDQSRSTYGGLQKVMVLPKNLVFSFDLEVQGKLQIDGELSIELMEPLEQQRVNKIKEVIAK